MATGHTMLRTTVSAVFESLAGKTITKGAATIIAGCAVDLSEGDFLKIIADTVERAALREDATRHQISADDVIKAIRFPSAD